jgi:hypothetical protein
MPGGVALCGAWGRPVRRRGPLPRVTSRASGSYTRGPVARPLGFIVLYIISLALKWRDHSTRRGGGSVVGRRWGQSQARGPLGAANSSTAVTRDPFPPQACPPRCPGARARAFLVSHGARAGALAARPRPRGHSAARAQRRPAPHTNGPRLSAQWTVVRLWQPCPPRRPGPSLMRSRACNPLPQLLWRPTRAAAASAAAPRGAATRDAPTRAARVVRRGAPRGVQGECRRIARSTGRVQRPSDLAAHAGTPATGPPPRRRRLVWRRRRLGGRL